MKKANEIIQTLQNQPQYNNKINQVQCIKKLVSLFLPNLQRYILFSYIKNETLFIVLNHNSGKQEFDNSIKMIKELLKTHKPIECSTITIKEIRSFVTHTSRKKHLSKINKKISIPTYQERSNGCFSCEVLKGTPLYDVAKEIQRIICERG